MGHAGTLVSFGRAGGAAGMGQHKQVAVIGPGVQAGDVAFNLAGLATVAIKRTDLIEVKQRQPTPKSDVVVNF
jgi:hypothetical protein